ncbi:hypothetical protein ACFL6U_01650 [Planctomycetota bacterium]
MRTKPFQQWARKGLRASLLAELALTQHTQTDNVRLERRSHKHAHPTTPARAH